MIRYDHHGNKKECKSYDGTVNRVSYYFEIYNDSTIEVKEIGQGPLKTVFVAIIVDGAAYLMHQRKFEAGRPHLRKNVEVLAETLRGIRQSFVGVNTCV